MRKILIISGTVFLLILSAIILVLLFRNPLLNKTADILISSLKEQYGRDIKLENALFTDKSMQFTRLCVSQKPDFSKGSFFCADKVILYPDYSSKAERTSSSFFIRDLIIENAEINIREKNGRWDFEDLTNASEPESSNSSDGKNTGKDKKYFEDTWIIDNLTLKNATISAESETNRFSVQMKKTDLELSHEGKIFTLTGQAEMKTELSGRPVKAPVSVNLKTFFSSGELSEIHGDMNTGRLEWDKISLQKLRLHTDMAGISRPVAGKNYISRFSAEGLLIPEDDPYIYDKVPQYLKLFAAAVGRPAPVIKDAEIHSVKGHFSLENNTIELQNMSLRSNFMELDGGMKIDGGTETSVASAAVLIGKNNVKLHISGNMNNPVLKPLLSETLAKKLKQSYMDFQKFVLGYFPVTDKNR